MSADGGSVVATAVVTPGQRLAHTDEYRAGPGTYIRGSRLYATLVGVRQVTASSGDEVSRA